MKALKGAVLGLLILANSCASLAYCASRHETKDNLVKVVSGIVVRECKETEESLDLKEYRIEKDIKDMDKFIRLSYQKCSLLEDFIKIVTVGGLIAPKSFKDFSRLRKDISSAQNKILNSIYMEDISEIDEDLFGSYLAKNVSYGDLMEMYNKAFDFGIESVGNEVKKGRKKTEMEEKRRFLLASYINGYYYIESVYKGAKGNARDKPRNAKEINLASEHPQ